MVEDIWERTKNALIMKMNSEKNNSLPKPKPIEIVSNPIPFGAQEEDDSDSSSLSSLNSV